MSFCPGVVRDIIVGSCLLRDRLTAQSYRHFLEAILPGLLEDVPSAVRQRVCGFSMMELQRGMGKVCGCGRLTVENRLRGLLDCRM